MSNIVSVSQRKLNTAQARALTLLAASPQGVAEGLLAAHGTSIDTMLELIKSGFATAVGERVRCSDRWIEVARVEITDAGCKAIG